LQHEKSGAGILCQVKTRHEEQASVLALAKDVVGIVAMLGKVEDSNLSRCFFAYMFFFFACEIMHSFQSCNSFFVSLVSVTLLLSKIKDDLFFRFLNIYEM
jgi:hypothetical protein